MFFFIFKLIIIFLLLISCLLLTLSSLLYLFCLRVDHDLVRVGLIGLMFGLAMAHDHIMVVKKTGSKCQV